MLNLLRFLKIRSAELSNGTQMHCQTATSAVYFWTSYNSLLIFIQFSMMIIICLMWRCSHLHHLYDHFDYEWISDKLDLTESLMSQFSLIHTKNLNYNHCCWWRKIRQISQVKNFSACLMSSVQFCCRILWFFTVNSHFIQCSSISFLYKKTICSLSERWSSLCFLWKS